MNRILLKSFVVLTVLVFFCSNAFAEIRDDFADEYFSDKVIEKPGTNLDYNYESVEKVPICLKIENKIKTGKDSEIYEGQKVGFSVVKNVEYGGKISVKAGTKATAIIETISQRGMNGVPAVIVLNNFEIPGIDKNLLGGAFTKRGKSLTIFILPVKWVLTPIPLAGSTTNFILGGNAVLSPKKAVKIYYYPER